MVHKLTSTRVFVDIIKVQSFKLFRSAKFYSLLWDVCDITNFLSVCLFNFKFF